MSLKIDSAFLAGMRDFDPGLTNALHECDSKTTAEGRDFVLIGELLDRLNVNEKKVMRYLESGKLTPYKINERRNLEKVSSWVKSMGLDGLFVLIEDFIPLVYNIKPVHGWPQRTLEPETSGTIAGPLDAKEARKAGSSKAQLEAKNRSIEAAYYVSQRIAENGLLAKEVTKGKVQGYLGEKYSEHGDTLLFRDVWKSIPYSDKNSGGRPPGK